MSRANNNNDMLLAALLPPVAMRVANGRIASSSSPSSPLVIRECLDCAEDSTAHFSPAVVVIGDDDDDLDAPQAAACRIVCISDTHGFEEQLEPLPDGDILLHCGDYALDGNPTRALTAHNRFDLWLAAQPHRHKVVVRGNHDPRHASFPESGAIFVGPDSPIHTRDMCGLRFAFCPYPARGVLRSVMAPCDVLVSHVPPRGVLDLCHGGDRVGSQVLTDAIDSLLVPPRLIVFGHIHESRGVANVRFTSGSLVGARCSSNMETTALNVAMANAGMATQLIRGPTVASLKPRDSLMGLPRQTGGTDHRILSIHLGGADAVEGDADEARCVEGSVQAHLALFELSNGTADGGCEACSLLLHGHLPAKPLAAAVPSDVCDVVLSALDYVASRVCSSPTGVVDHVFLSTAAPMSSARVQAVETAVCSALQANEPRSTALPTVMWLSASLWRTALLKSREQTSESRTAKAAERIASQLLNDLGGSACSAETHPDGTLESTAAEAVLVGYAALLRLGWLHREPAVRRHSNGKIATSHGRMQPGMQRKARKRAERLQAL